jgi:hypothetical protein
MIRHTVFKFHFDACEVLRDARKAHIQEPQVDRVILEDPTICQEREERVTNLPGGARNNNLHCKAGSDESNKGY